MLPSHTTPVPLTPLTHRPPISTLFPYTTLFRSRSHRRVPASSHRREAFADRRRRRVRRDGGEERDERDARSEEHTSELQSHVNLVCRLLLEKKKKKEDMIATRRLLSETST